MVQITRIPPTILETVGNPFLNVIVIYLIHELACNLNVNVVFTPKAYTCKDEKNIYCTTGCVNHALLTILLYCRNPDLTIVGSLAVVVM